METVLKFLTLDMKIADYQQLCEWYFEGISVRCNTPISFQILVSKLGLFDSDTIISNEELEVMENFRIKQHMQVNSKDLVIGQQIAQSSSNNNKFMNLMVIKEDEQPVYLCSEDDEENYSKYKEHILKLNEMKYLCSNDIRVCSQVQFLVLDFRHTKKAKLTALSDSPIPVWEIEESNVKEAIAKLSNLDSQQPNKYHCVVLMTYPNVIESSSKPGKQLTKEHLQELNVYKKMADYLRKRNFVSVVEGGARELTK